MAKVGQIQAEAIYSILSRHIETLINEGLWDQYKNKIPQLISQIKDVRNYLNNCMFPGPRDEQWASDMEYFESIIKKIEYHSNHTEDTIISNAIDNRDTVHL